MGEEVVVVVVIELIHYSLIISGVCWEQSHFFCLLSEHSWCSKSYLLVLLMCMVWVFLCAHLF